MLLDNEATPASTLEPLKRVFTASRQATVLVRQLLLFSRKRVPRREVVDLNTEMEAVSAMIARLLGRPRDSQTLPDAARLGRRMALTLPLLPPPQ